MYDPIVRAKEIEGLVVDGNKRRYYRISRGGLWYGGIATADCCGCNLKCVFCWSNYPRDNPDKCGKFYTPEEVFNSLVRCAKKHGYNQLRISGNEVTIAKEHLFELLELVDKTDYLFIIETNGTLIDKEYAKELSKFKNIQVRVSIKGTNPEEFSKLTGAKPEGFNLQLQALQNLVLYDVACWPCIVISFSPKENFIKLKKIISEIDRRLAEEIEIEDIFLLPHVEERLKKANIKPFTYYKTIELAKREECK